MYRYTFTSSTTWTVPASVKSAYVSIAGGGAGGVSDFPAPSSTNVALISGASGGFLVSYPLNLTPGESIPITIGAGGPAGPNTTVQAGTTTFGTYLSCTGGIQYGGPGNCGSGVGFGAYGTYVITSGGIVNGGVTSLGYGTGGSVTRCAGCTGTYSTSGQNGYSGVVIVDVLY